LRKSAEPSRPLGKALIPIEWCAWLLATLLVLAPLAPDPSRAVFGAAGETGIYSYDATATVSRPEVELRARPVKRAAEFAARGGGDPAHVAVFLVELPQTAPTEVAEAGRELRPRATPACSARSPPMSAAPIA
jgi:hypothetical protein